MLGPKQARENGTIIDDIPPLLDYTGTVTLTITAGYFDFPLEKYGLTAYINLRRPSEEELEHFPIMDITYEDEWDPYKAPKTFMLSIQHQYSTRREMYMMMNLFMTG